MAGLMAMIIAPPTACRARKMTRNNRVGAAPHRAELMVKIEESQHPEEFLAHHIHQSAQGQKEAGNNDEISNDDPFHHAA